MAVVNGYCTELELRGHLEDGGANLPTVLLERAINAASRAIDGYCRRKFWLDAAETVHSYKVGSTTRVNVDDIGSLSGLIVKTDPGLEAPGPRPGRRPTTSSGH